MGSDTSYQLNPTAVDWSTQYATYYQGDYVADGNITTLWLSAYGAVDSPEWTIVDFGETAAVSGFATHPPHYGGHLQYYPQGFDIELSADGASWTPALQVTDLTATFGAWDEWSIAPTPARYARLTTTQRGIGACQEPYGCIFSTYVGIAELKAFAKAESHDVQLVWVAPGDDGWSGIAQQYDLRRAQAPIDDATFDSLVQVGVDPPQIAGSLEIVQIPDLEWETVHYFALKTADEAGNWSDLSNIASIVTPGIPPAPVSDLTPVDAGLGWIALAWTATGDDGMIGQADAYDLRYSEAPIDAATWSAAFPVMNAPLPGNPGDAEYMVVDGLDHTTTYHFAMKVLDEMGNASILSNVAIYGTLDGTAPAAVTDLSASTNSDSTGSIELAWTAPGDDGLDGLAASYEIRVSESPIADDAGFELGIPVSAPAPSTPGTAETLVVSGLQPEADYWIALKTADESGNESALSNVATAATRDEAPAAVSDLSVSGATGTGASASWTATGDDGNTGTAASYDLRISEAPIDEDNFSSPRPCRASPPPARRARTSR